MYDAHDAGVESWERRNRWPPDAHDVGPETWERKSRRALTLLMLVRRAGKGEADGH